MKRFLALLLCLLMALPAACAETIQDCHRVKLTYKDSEQKKARISIWHIDTALDSVDEAINGLVQAYADEMLPVLRPGKDYNNKNSRLNISIRYSRTGLRWMSFLVQAREIYFLETTQVRTTTQTYDMISGERIYLTDIFPEGSEGWSILAGAVRDTVNAYYPTQTADAAQLEAFVALDNLQTLDFTLHGMSLVLHIPAETFYEGRVGLIEVTLMYPELRPYMTAQAQEQTDNLRYYKTCALTFDDGPYGNSTDLTLRSLMGGGVRATFFLLGERIEDYEWVVKRQHDEGHAIGAHNWTHDAPGKVKDDVLRQTKPRFDDVLGSLTGDCVRYGRAPGGEYKPMARVQAGLPMIQWSVNPSDSLTVEGISPSRLINDVLHSVFDGSIILCHDSKMNTAKAVADLVKGLQEDGYMLLTIDELFAKDGVELQPDTPYYRCTDGETGPQ